MAWLRRLLAAALRLLHGGAGTAPDLEITVRLDRQSGRLAAVERDLARIGPQVAALEARTETLRRRLKNRAPGSADVEAALGLVEEIRAEHERMRARVSAAVRFEERLEQLEDQLAALSRTSTRT
jgi:chromosome segregation ATPase